MCGLGLHRAILNQIEAEQLQEAFETPPAPQNAVKTSRKIQHINTSTQIKQTQHIRTYVCPYVRVYFLSPHDEQPWAAASDMR